MSADTLQTLCDRQAISEALWRYCRTLDRMDREGARALRHHPHSLPPRAV